MGVMKRSLGLVLAAVLATGIAVTAGFATDTGSQTQSPKQAAPVVWPNWFHSVPKVEPTSIRWPTSACSSYVVGIRWSVWSNSAAQGRGTLMTNDALTPGGPMSCAGAHWTPHRGFLVKLWRPRCKVIDKGTPVFTDTNLWSPRGMDSGDLIGSICRNASAVR
jgi:hypothetical protein